MQQSKFIYIKLICVMIFWGTSFVSGRVLAADFHPFNVGVMRFGVASLVLVPLLFFKSPQFYKMTFSQFLKVLALGFTGIFSYNVFFFSGLQLVEAGRSSVIIAMNPALTAFFSIFFLKEKLSRYKILGVLVALFGVIFVAMKGEFTELFNRGFGQGELFLFGAVLSWVSYTILGKIFLKKLTVLEATTWACALGTCMLLPFALSHNLIGEIQEVGVNHIAHIANIGILTTCVGFIWYYDAIKVLGASAASSFINLVPIIGIIAGAFFLNETISFFLILGSSFVISGVFLVNQKRG